jgi:hypothetical protein
LALNYQIYLLGSCWRVPWANGKRVVATNLLIWFIPIFKKHDMDIRESLRAILTGIALCAFLPALLHAEGDVPEHRTDGAQISERKLDKSMAPIQSREQLELYMQSMPEALNPIARLSPHARHEFLKSLSFSDNGLAQFRHTELQNELTPTEIYQVLRLFGMQGAASGMENARVESPGDLSLLQKGQDDGMSSRVQAEDPPGDPCGPYVNGQCAGIGQCEISNTMCCDPPSCPPEPWPPWDPPTDPQ